ncbi:GIY-YIG nuclease family protein [Corynebacterium comes]|uniref:GIY-YIG domain-containing protein n=1 Tax=Corynebacterium comes TaxID=2675218 RepID=A0A6B8WCK4_9CORY|nr:GIY-YIG nuclease family protein [Corynebacterium comes]QGU04528.1 hypothetical protein CETAM_06325 [Corynebacterium comes]
MPSSTPRRWAVTGLNTISALIGNEDPCGIYVLEFENGESYVGQAVDVRKRFVSHCRNSAHHPAWHDITHISFTPYPAAELNVRETTVIQALKREGCPLRNKAMNLFHEQVSPLDKVISPVDQYHWADSEYLHRTASQVPERKMARAIADLPPGASKMSRLPMYGECLADVAAFIDLVLPDPLATMEKYWTVSDCPSTNGGRFYTVNVGVLEMLRCIRAFGERSCLNTIVWPELRDEDPDSSMLFTFEEPEGIEVLAYNLTYPKATVTAAEFETGSLRGLLESNPDVLADARALAVALMRTGTAGLFRRWHSKELTREALLEIWEHRQRK